MEWAVTVLRLRARIIGVRISLLHVTELENLPESDAG